MAHELKKLKQSSDAYMSQARYLELKNYCRQYNEWKEAIGQISLLQSASYKNDCVQRSDISDPTSDLATKRLYYLRKIESVDKVLFMFDEDVRPFIKEAVVDGVSWEVMRARKTWVPLPQKVWYKQLRAFYALLDRQQYSQAVL